MPAAILHTEQVDGFRSPQWVARPLDDSARPAVERAQAALVLRCAPGRREVIIALLIRLAVQWPAVSKDPHAFGLTVSDMADDLAQFSESQVAAACVDWRQTENWFPKSADLRGKLLTMQAYDRMHLRRAKVLLGEEQPRSYELPHPSERAGNVFHIEEALEALARGKRVKA